MTKNKQESAAREDLTKINPNSENTIPKKPCPTKISVTRAIKTLLKDTDLCVVIYLDINGQPVLNHNGSEFDSLRLAVGAVRAMKSNVLLQLEC